MDHPQIPQFNDDPPDKETGPRRRTRESESSSAHSKDNKRRKSSSNSSSDSNLIDTTTRRGAASTKQVEGTHGTDVSIDTTASMLAAIDKRGYYRDLIIDAYSVLHNILMPSEFPWNQPIVPVIKNLPVDIDEMPAIVTTGKNVDHGEFSSAFYHELKSHDGIIEVACRSSDPGVILLGRRQRHSANKQSRLNSRSLLAYDDIEKPGEGLLHIYEGSRNIDQNEGSSSVSIGAERKISLRLDSTSSRSNILPIDKLGDAYTYVQIPALLPSEVRTGKKVDEHEAASLQRLLGSYNHQMDEKSTGDDQDSNNKRYGRTRRVWWSRDHVAISKRESTSILTGEKVPDMAYRPRRIKLLIKVGGTLSFVRKDSIENYASLLDRWSNGNDVDENNLTLSPALISTIFHNMEQVDCSATHSWQPSRLTTKILVNNTLRLLHQHEQSKLTVGGICFKPPCLNVVPTREDRVVVVCSEVGSLSGPIDTPSAWRHLLSGTNLCAICFSECHNDAWITCRKNDCSVSAHLNCLGRKHLVSRTEGVWDCFLCSPKLSNHPPKCERCGFAEGPSRVEDNGCAIYPTLEHITCSVWCDGANISRTCTVCGKGSGVVVMCAARSCQVAVHPICAGIANIMSHHHRDSFMSKDAFLCSQYTLAMIRVGSDDGRTSPRIQPVIYCGFHNPERQLELQGMYPDGNFLSGAMEVYGRNNQEPT